MGVAEVFFFILPTD